MWSKLLDKASNRPVVAWGLAMATIGYLCLLFGPDRVWGLLTALVPRFGAVP